MKLRITVDDKAYDVDVDVVEDEPSQGAWQQPAPQYARPLRPAAAGVSAGASGEESKAAHGEAVADESKVVRSPIMGIVVRVSAEAGQDIKVDDTLLVLEAMKMESSITSPAEGKIKEIRAKPGDSVTSGQVLVVFE